MIQYILKKVKKRDIKYLLYIIIFNIIILSNFMKMHFAQDTYCTILNGFKITAEKTFLKSGRPITAIILNIFDFLNININAFVIIMSITGIFAVSLAIYTILKTIKKFYNINTLNKMVTIGSLSFITVLNFCTLELFVFAESGMLCISLLLSVMAACENASNSKYKYLKMCIYLSIAVLIHQAIINIYVPLSFMIIVIKNKNNIRQIFKEGIIALIIYGGSIIINILVSKSINIFFGIAQRPTVFPTINHILVTYSKYLNVLAVNTLYIGAKYWYIILIFIITLIYFIKNITNRDKKIYLLYYCIILFSSILLPILPVVLEEEQSQYLELRMAISFGASIGIMMLYTILTNKNNSVKLYKCIYIISIIFFVINSIYIINASSEMIAANLLDRNYANIILNKIDKYESENGIKVKKIALDYDINPEYYYLGSKHFRCLNYKSLSTSWAMIGVLQTYSDRKFDEIDVPENIHSNYFANKDWDNYADEQLIFENDTLYLCIY
ncbi:MAG: glucosyltransferase domain-containing protein [Clostridia bacterium]|nr:glucosyltransferase domain-containing protein [Clostridia bacterium]